MRSHLTLPLLLVLPLTITAQEKQKPTPGNEPIKVVKLDRKDPVTYDKDVEPIFVKKCFVCHSGNVKESRLDLGTYETLMKGGKRGAAVVPGKSQDSLLVKVSGRTHKPFMPVRFPGCSVAEHRQNGEPEGTQCRQNHPQRGSLLRWTVAGPARRAGVHRLDGLSAGWPAAFRLRGRPG